MSQGKSESLTPVLFHKTKVRKTKNNPRDASWSFNPFSSSFYGSPNNEDHNRSPYYSKSKQRAPDTYAQYQKNDTSLFGYLKIIFSFLYLLITDFSLMRVKEMFYAIFDFFFGSIIRKIRGNSTFVLCVAVVVCLCCLGFIMDVAKNGYDEAMNPKNH